MSTTIHMCDWKRMYIFSFKRASIFLPTRIFGPFAGPAWPYYANIIFFVTGTWVSRHDGSSKKNWGGGGSKRSLKKEDFAPIGTKSWRCGGGGGINSPLDQVPPLPTALVSSEFNWNSTFICDRRRLVRTFEGQFSRLKSNNLRLWSFMLFYLITELCYFSKSGGANCNRMFIPSLFECFIWSNGILLFNFWIWASYLL